MNAAFHVPVSGSCVRPMTCDLLELFLLFEIKPKLWKSTHQQSCFSEMEKNLECINSAQKHEYLGEFHCSVLTRPAWRNVEPLSQINRSDWFRSFYCLRGFLWHLRFLFQKHVQIFSKGHMSYSLLESASHHGRNSWKCPQLSERKMCLVESPQKKWTNTHTCYDITTATAQVLPLNPECKD